MKILLIYSPNYDPWKLLQRVPRDVTALVFKTVSLKLTRRQRKHIHVLPADLTAGSSNGIRLATILQRLSKPEVVINVWLGGPQVPSLLEDCIEHGELTRVMSISVRWELNNLAAHIHAMRLQDTCKGLVNLRSV